MRRASPEQMLGVIHYHVMVVERAQDVMLHALAHYDAKPTSVRQSRLWRLRVAAALANEALEDVAGPLPGGPDYEDEDERES